MYLFLYPKHNKVEVSLGLASSRGSRRESISCLFRLLVAASTPWFVAELLQSLLSLSHCFLYFCHQSFLCIHLVKTLGFTFKDPLNNPGWVIIIQFKTVNLSTFAKSHLPYMVTTQFPGIRIWISLRVIIQSTIWNMISYLLLWFVTMICYGQLILSVQFNDF